MDDETEQLNELTDEQRQRLRAIDIDCEHQLAHAERAYRQQIAELKQIYAKERRAVLLGQPAPPPKEPQ